VYVNAENLDIRKHDGRNVQATQIHEKEKRIRDHFHKKRRKEMFLKRWINRRQKYHGGLEKKEEKIKQDGASISEPPR